MRKSDMLKSDTFLKFSRNSEKSVQKLTCLKVTHFWEFGCTQNVSLLRMTVYDNDLQAPNYNGVVFQQANDEMNLEMSIIRSKFDQNRSI